MKINGYNVFYSKGEGYRAYDKDALIFQVKPNGITTIATLFEG